jgi:Flp pilus assembly protein TadD
MAPGNARAYTSAQPMSKRRKQPPQIATTEPPRGSALPWLMAGLLVLLVFVAYRPAAGGAFIWDDDDYVARNPSLRAAGGLVDIWFKPTESPQYYPMVFTTYWLEYRLWGTDPRGYHETNVLLHAASAVLLWRILRRLRVPGAYFAAAIFAAHPVMVESVAWITERKNTLSMLFYLASLYAYLRFARVDEGPPPPEPAPSQWGWYAAALALFLLALFSKTVTASLPAAILLILWWKGRLEKRHVALLAPFFVMGVAGGWLTRHLEYAHVGASGPEWNYTLPQRVLIAGRAVWFYAAKLLVPYKLTFVYSKWPVDPASAAQWLFPVLAVGLVIALVLLRKRIGRGPLVAVLLFGGTLVPALGFVNVYPMRYTFVADHYQYHASAGLIALAAAGITLALARLPRRARLRAGLQVALVLVLSLLTFSQAAIYRDKRTLWSDTVAKSPDSWMAWTNLGHAAAAETPPDFETARRAYQKALDLAPHVADTRYNVGHLHLREGNLAAAQAEFARAVEIEPRYAMAHNMLGYTLAAQRQADAALAAYRKAIELDPEYGEAHFNLGVALRDRGDLDAAADHFAKSAELDPGAAKPLRELANVRIKQQRFAEAAEALGRLIARSPANAEAHFDRGLALRKLGRLDEASAEIAEAFRLKPELQQRLMGPR